MKKTNDPYGVCIERIPIDWDTMFKDIGNRAIYKKRSARIYKIGIPIICSIIISSILMTFSTNNRALKNYLEASDTINIPGEIIGYDIPQSFKSLTGYPGAYDGLAVNRTIICSTSLEERL